MTKLPRSEFAILCVLIELWRQARWPQDVCVKKLRNMGYNDKEIDALIAAHGT